MRDLGTLPGGDFSRALGVNDAGVIVGAATLPGNAYHAVIWTVSGIRDLNDALPANSGIVLFQAHAISNSGIILAYGARVQDLDQDLHETPGRVYILTPQ
jgi:hypothetical protein